MRLRPGQQVTVLPPYDDDPYILNFQHYGTVASSTEGDVTVELEATVPPGERLGPFPNERIALGWRDENGRWR